jgi:uncharacterized protein YcnI
MRNVLARILLALAVVLFQHGAVAHAFSHAGEAAQHEKQDGDLHAPHGCDACHAYAAADGGEPPTATFVLSAAAGVIAAPSIAVAPRAQRPAHDFPIRAPPARP